MLRPSHFAPLLLALLLSVVLLKTLAVREVGFGWALRLAFLVAVPLGGWALARACGVARVRRNVAVAATLVVALPAVLLTPWPYEVESAARGLDVPPGATLHAAHRSGSMVCFDQCSTASLEWRWPAGANVTELTEEAARLAREDGWDLEVERPPGWNDPRTAWLDFGWIAGTKPGLRMVATIHPCADLAVAEGAQRSPCPEAQTRPVAMLVTVSGG